MPDTSSQTPYSDAIAPLIAPFMQSATAVVMPEPEATPAAGGCYTRDPVTGVLTLVTPSTIQE